MIDIKFKVDGYQNLAKWPKEIEEGLFSGMRQAMYLVQRTAKYTYLGGRALKRRSGRLQGSIAYKLKKTSTGVTGTVGTLRYTVPYAAVWEYGGKYPRTIVDIKRARALHFFDKGTEVFTKRADVPARTIDARPYLMPSIKDNMTKMLSIFGRFISGKMNKEKVL